MTPQEAAKYNLKNVRVVCNDGYTREGKCYMYTDLDDDDELYVYFDIGNVIIDLDDINQIIEIKN